MSEIRTIYELINAFGISFNDILTILKTMGNDNRLTILITLLTGEKTFNDLKEETQLQKTALSNHISQLIKAALIFRPDYNKYKLTSDGELFLTMIEAAYRKSEIREKQQIEGLQKRQFSETFVKSFFGK